METSHQNVNNTSNDVTEDDSDGELEDVDDFLPKEVEYNMDNESRGCFMIFIQDTFDERLEIHSLCHSDADCAKLKEIAKNLGFKDMDIKIYRNRRRQEILKELEQMSEDNHGKRDCFACAILSHGNDEDIIYAKDAEMHLWEFMEPFKDDNCPTLSEKPKLFFVEACRDINKTTQAGTTAQSSKLQPKAEQDQSKSTIVCQATTDVVPEMKALTIQPETNFYIAYYSPQCPIRNIRNGSLFVKVLHKCFLKYGKDLELTQIMKKVNNGIASLRPESQIPAISDQLISEVKFKPKAGHFVPIIEIDGQSKSQNTSLSKTAEYNMKNGKRGYFMIFIQETFDSKTGLKQRGGSDADCTNLKEIAEKLGFEYKVYCNEGRKKILEELKEMSSMNHKEYDCFACAILSHGKEGDIMWAYDAEMPLSDFMEPFYAKSCPTLKGKPKLFFIQACRGMWMDEPADVSKLEYDVEKEIENEVVILPTEPDFLIAHASQPCFVSWRHTKEGSWFVQALHKCFLEYGHKLELLQIMTKVNNVVAQNYNEIEEAIQIPSIATQLRYEVKFEPKTATSSRDEFENNIDRESSNECKADGKLTDKGFNSSDEYKMTHEKRSCFTVFIQDEFDESLKIPQRTGSEVDEQMLEEISKKLGFKICFHRNLCKEEIYEKLEEMKGGEYYSHDCFACAILSHGEEENMVYVKDGKMQLKEFMEPFNAINCPSLCGKPKLFFIQASRDFPKEQTSFIESDDTTPFVDDGFEIKNVMIPARSDFLIAHAFPPRSGLASEKDTTDGSRFVKALHKCFHDYGDELEIMQIMTKVNEMMSGTPKSGGSERKLRQFLSVCTRLRSEMRFKPKTNNSHQ